MRPLPLIYRTTDHIHAATRSRRLTAIVNAVMAIVLVTELTLPSRGAAQAPDSPSELLERVSQTQKLKSQLEAHMRELRGRLDAEIYKLKSWSASNAIGRPVRWPMTAAKVEMGLFTHDIVAEAESPDVEVRCQLIAVEEHKHLQLQYPRGTQFTCVGRVGSVSHLAQKTVISLTDAKAMSAAPRTGVARDRLAVEPIITTPKVSVEHARKAIEQFQEACSSLFTTHAIDVVELKATVHDGWSPRAQAWGWGAEIWIEVILRDLTHTFPDARAGGQHLWYFLGGGEKSGFQAQKRISQTACGLPVRDDQPDAFVPIPGLAAVLPAAL